jgi:hypothetical protein
MAAPIGRPEDMDMRSTIAAPASRPSTSWLTVALGIGLVVALSVAVSVSFGLGQGIADETGTIVRSHPVAGYPVHYGFAGPSRVGPNAGSRIGYLPHYGLAGPSWVGPTTAPIAAAAGYPLHDGLAGPSQVDKRR